MRLLMLLGLCVGLVSCGGGGSEGASVTTLSAGNLRFGLTTTVTVNGRGLRDSIHLAVEGPCENLAAIPSFSDDTQQFTCDVRGVGEVRFFVIDTAGAFIAQLTAQVPTPQVSFTTALGSFIVELDPVRAPATALNFTNYVLSGFFRNTLIHRAIAGRGVLTGGYTSGLQAKTATGSAFALESDNGLKNLRGTIGMYYPTTPDSARTQWYVNVADNADLDRVDDSQPGFAVFGKVVSGMDVIDAMSVVPTKTDAATGLTDVPATEILITGVTRVR